MGCGFLAGRCSTIPDQTSKGCPALSNVLRLEPIFLLRKHSGGKTIRYKTISTETDQAGGLMQAAPGSLDKPETMKDLEKDPPEPKSGTGDMVKHHRIQIQCEEKNQRSKVKWTYPRNPCHPVTFPTDARIPGNKPSRGTKPLKIKNRSTH